MSSPKLTVVLSAQPNADFAPDSHRGSVQIEPREVPVASIAEALRTFRDFIGDNDLGAGNLGGNAGLIRRDGQPLARVALNGTLWQVGPDGQDTGRQFVRPRFSHIGEIVRVLRETADLTRNELSDVTGVAASTIRNLETRRHTASAWTWRQILAHPALQDLPQLAKESGLEMPIPVPGSGTPGGNAGGSGGTPGPGHGGDGGDDGDGSGGGSSGSGGGR